MIAIKYFLLFVVAITLCMGCKSPEKLKQQNISKYLFQKWDVAFIYTANRTTTGLEMGEPTYEFTTNYERIKAYTEPPKEEKIKFQIKKDSLFYPENPKLPAMHIQKVTKDTLILHNDKINVTWHLFIKAQ